MRDGHDVRFALPFLSKTNRILVMLEGAMTQIAFGCGKLVCVRHVDDAVVAYSDFFEWVCHTLQTRHFGHVEA